MLSGFVYMKGVMKLLISHLINAWPTSLPPIALLTYLSFRIHVGVELLQADSQSGDAMLKKLWHHSDAIMCCSVKTNVIIVPTF